MLSLSFSLVTRQRAHSGGRVLAVVPPSPVMRRSSDPQVSPSASDNPPEFPPRTSHSAHSSPAHHPNYQSHSSETAGSYCDLRPCPSGPPKPPTKSYVERLRVEEGTVEGAREEGEGVFSAPQVETSSSFKPSRYETTKPAFQICISWCFHIVYYMTRTHSILKCICEFYDLSYINACFERKGHDYDSVFSFS